MSSNNAAKLGFGHDSPDGGVWVPHDRDHADDEASEMSEGASIGSVTVDLGDSHSFRDPVDLRGEDFCRVNMRAAGRFPARVCGQPKEACKRPNHLNKSDEPELCGPSGFCVRSGTKNGLPDGRMDVGVLEESQVEELKEQERLRTLKDLEAFRVPEEEVLFQADPIQVETVAEGEGTGPSHHRDYKPSPFKDPDQPVKAPTGLDPATPDPATARLRTVGQQATDRVSNETSDTKPGPSVTSQEPLFPGKEPSKVPPGKRASAPVDEGPSKQVSWGGASTAPASAPEAPTLLHGILDPVLGARHLTDSGTEANHLAGAGKSVAQVFADSSSAMRWMNQAPAVAKPPPSTPERPVSGTWHGMVSPNGVKSLVTDSSRATFLRSEGFTFEAAFEEEVSAKVWMATPAPPRKLPEGTPCEPASSQGQPVPSTSADLTKCRVGKDDSVTPQEIFGLNVNTRAMDDASLPANLKGKEARHAVCDSVVDVMALPGGHRRREGNEDYFDTTGTEAIVAMLLNRRETGLHLNYRAASMNGLQQIKSKMDLMEFLERVQETCEEQEETQTSQLTMVLDNLGYPYEDIQDHLRQGLLLRPVRETFACCVCFITSLSNHAAKVQEGGWKSSLPHYLLRHYQEKLGLIRTRSASHRELVLRNCAFLREAKRISFCPTKVNHSLWPLLAGGTSNPTANGTTPEPDRAPCSTCGRSGLHAAGATCPLLPLTSGERSSLLAGLRFRSAQKAVRHVRQALSTDPHADHGEVISAAREAAES